ncbi:MAG: sulfatase-like hydrolase/transferase [Vicinamibacterales bacterium]
MTTVLRAHSGGSVRAAPPSWQRYRLIGMLIGAELVIATAVRLVLFAVYRDSSAFRDVAVILAAGLVFDVLATLTAFLPLFAIVSMFRLRWLRSRMRTAVVAAISFVLCFDAFVQFFFFDEYSARYNHLALDYLMYPDEVFGNIFASYNVPLFAAIAVVGAIALTWWATRTLRLESPPMPWRTRFAGVAMTMGLALTLWGAWTVMPAAVTPNRISNELALNGWAELIRAYFTSNLDYKAYYAMVDPAEAVQRVADLIGQPNTAAGLQRHFAPHAHPAQPLDIVIIMEESFGSVFSQRFGGETQLPVTPELDRWSHQGIALTNLIANGNRTVRGMEGILCSFLPLPGDAIIKRDRSTGLASIANVLTARGYQSIFFTGGYGLFDNVKAFMLANGFERVVEQPDYPGDAFRTVWGVADEFVFDEMLRQQQVAKAAGRSWFGTVITGSNHKPFDVPPGRVDWPADRSRRRGAMLYADWALGRYLTQAKERGLLDHTIVLIVGDHGSRVYGAEEIPVASYRVPAVFLTPDPADRDVTIDRLASQVDLAPTVLSLAGIEYDAPFFGRDLIGLPSDGGRAFVNHNRSIGLLTDTSMAVLGLHQTVRFYSRPNRASDAFTEASTAETVELAKDAQAAFQTANQVYRDRQYALRH